MATVALPQTRADIFRQGLNQAHGTITYWAGAWGTITLDGAQRVEYFVSLDRFPAEEQKDVADGCRVVFDAKPGQADMKSLTLPAGTKRHKPKVSSARLFNFSR